MWYSIISGDQISNRLSMDYPDSSKPWMGYHTTSWLDIVNGARDDMMYDESDMDGDVMDDDSMSID